MIKVTILNNKHHDEAMFGGWAPRHAMYEVITFDMPAVIDQSEFRDHLRILRTIAHQFGRSNPCAQWARDYRDKSPRMFLCGDVVKLDGVPYAFQPFSWDEVHPDLLKIEAFVELPSVSEIEALPSVSESLSSLTGWINDLAQVFEVPTAYVYGGTAGGINVQYPIAT